MRIKSVPSCAASRKSCRMETTNKYYWMSLLHQSTRQKCLLEKPSCVTRSFTWQVSYDSPMAKAKTMTNDSIHKDSELQKLFVKTGPRSLEAFLNIFGKGYHMLLKSKRYGKRCIQPNKIDKLSSGESLLRTACVAVKRFGSEIGVKRSKILGFVNVWIKLKLGDVDMVCDTWAERSMVVLCKFYARRLSLMQQ